MNQEELELLRKYLQGNATPEEGRYIRRWLARNEDDENVWNLLREEWTQTSADNEQDLDMEDAWGEFKQKIRKPGEPVKRSHEIIHTNQRTRRKPFVLITISVVAILISAAFLFLFTQRSSTPNITMPEKITYNIKKTDRGEKLNISLPDGSFIKLNSSTQLRIPDDYNTGEERVVYLEGEAFFEVARDENKPFKVIAGKVITLVLGTSFNINTYSDQEDVKVAVVTGKVRVANDHQEIVLNPEEMTTVGPTTETLAKKIFDIDNITGWKNNLLIFDKVSFDEIIQRMEEWYGVEFVIEGKPQRTGKYSGRFENKSLKWVLEGLGFSSEFEYRIVDKTVYLKFK